jgi:hypothetical protein
MADADGTVGKSFGNASLQAAKTPCGFFNRQLPLMVKDGHARGVIAPVFKPLEPLEDPFAGPTKSDVANNSTHDAVLQWGTFRRGH